MAQNKQYTDTLENICSFAQPSNHLLTFQLMRAKPAESSIEKSSAKSEYFSFVTVAPGEGTDAQNRTYNFQNSICIKFSLQEIAGLSYVLRNTANGMGKICLPYIKFAKSSSNSKQVSVWEPPQQPVAQGQFQKPRTISISIKENNNQAISIGLTPDQAFAMAESLMLLFQKGMSLEFDRQVNSPKSFNSNKTNNSYANLNAQNNNGFPQNNSGFQPAQAPANAPFDQQTDPFGNIGDDFTNLLMNR